MRPANGWNRNWKNWPSNGTGKVLLTHVNIDQESGLIGNLASWACRPLSLRERAGDAALHRFDLARTRSSKNFPRISRENKWRLSQTLPYGLWPSPISPLMDGQAIKLIDVQWNSDGRTLVWLERRNARHSLVVKPDQMPPAST